MRVKALYARWVGGHGRGAGVGGGELARPSPLRLLPSPLILVGLISRLSCYQLIVLHPALPCTAPPCHPLPYPTMSSSVMSCLSLLFPTMLCLPSAFPCPALPFMLCPSLTSHVLPSPPSYNFTPEFQSCID